MKMRITAAVLAALMAASVYANDVNLISEAPETTDVEATEEVKTAIPYLVGDSAVVKSINENTIECLKNSDEVDLILKIGENTLFFDNLGNRLSLEDIKPDMKIVAYDNALSARLAIYPETFTPEIIVAVTDEETSFELDAFKASDSLGQYINYGETLAVNIGEDAEFIGYDGEEVERELEERIALITYKATTMSLPPIALAEKVVIIGAVPETLPALPDEEQEAETENVTESTFDEAKYADQAFTNPEGVKLYPLRQILEDNDFTIEWDDSSKTVIINGGKFEVRIGEDSYIRGRMAPISLGTAPVIIDGRTYVPASFFTEVIGL